MKRINKFLIAVSALALIFTSCSGEDGRDGFDGQDGLDGEQTIIYEKGGFTFEEANDYTIQEVIPDDIFVDDTDLILVYRLVRTDVNAGDVWELLPQTYFTDEGLVQFTFDHTSVDLELFLFADFDQSLIDTSFTTDQIFRFAVIPASVSSSATSLSSSSSYEQVAKDAVVIKL